MTSITKIILVLTFWGGVLAGGCSSNAEFAPSGSEVIKWPSANRQSTGKALSVGAEVVSAEDGSFRLKGVRYGLQKDIVQFVIEGRDTPKHGFDYLETRLKLSLIESEEQRIAFALGILGRFTENSARGKERIDNRKSSLFLVTTAELYPFVSLGGVRTNLYLDNRVLSLGLEYQLSYAIKLLAEGDYLFARKKRLEDKQDEEVRESRRLGLPEPKKEPIDYRDARGGLEIANGAFYVQILVGDDADGVVIQTGGGF